MYGSVTVLNCLIPFSHCKRKIKKKILIVEMIIHVRRTYIEPYICVSNLCKAKLRIYQAQTLLQFAFIIIQIDTMQIQIIHKRAHEL